MISCDNCKFYFALVHEEKEENDVLHKGKNPYFCDILNPTLAVYVMYYVNFLYILLNENPMLLHVNYSIHTEYIVYVNHRGHKLKQCLSDFERRMHVLVNIKSCILHYKNQSSRFLQGYYLNVKYGVPIGEQCPDSLKNYKRCNR